MINKIWIPIRGITIEEIKEEEQCPYIYKIKVKHKAKKKYIEKAITKQLINYLAEKTNVILIRKWRKVKTATINQHQKITYSGRYKTRENIPILKGEGQIIGIGDTGIDIGHPHFYDEQHELKYNIKNEKHRKFILYNTTIGDKYDDKDGHGTHVASIVAGKAETYNGMAPEAKIAFVDLEKDNKFKQPEMMGYLKSMLDAGAKVSTHSWNCDDNTKENCNYYSSAAHRIDEFMYKHPEHLVIVSAGNQGPSGASIAAPATAKNCLAVGSTKQPHTSFIELQQRLGYENIDRQPQAELLSSFSGRGPTIPDQRIKPEILTIGEYIVAARSNGLSNVHQTETTICKPNEKIFCSDEKGYIASAGTSQSTPVVAGAALLIREYLEKGYYPTGSLNTTNQRTTLSAALIKALLIHSAKPLKAKMVTKRAVDKDESFLYQTIIDEIGKPNNNEGFGEIQLNRILYFKDHPTRFDGESQSLNILDNKNIKNRETHRYCVTSYGPLRVTLTWTDHEGSTLSYYQLVNDLDLIVVDPTTTTTYYGNQMNNETFDRSNNVEYVQVRGPLHQTKKQIYYVYVHGFSVLTNQNYALVITGFGETTVLDTCEAPCVNNCSDHGQCNQGVCSCEEPTREGVDCHMPIQHLDECTSVNIRSKIQYFSFTQKKDRIAVLHVSLDHQEEIEITIYYSFEEQKPSKTKLDGSFTLEMIKNKPLGIIQTSPVDRQVYLAVHSSSIPNPHLKIKAFSKQKDTYNNNAHLCSYGFAVFANEKWYESRGINTFTIQQIQYDPKDNSTLVIRTEGSPLNMTIEFTIEKKLYQWNNFEPIIPDVPQQEVDQIKFNVYNVVGSFKVTVENIRMCDDEHIYDEDTMTIQSHTGGKNYLRIAPTTCKFILKKKEKVHHVLQFDHFSLANKDAITIYPVKQQKLTFQGSQYPSIIETDVNQDVEIVFYIQKDNTKLGSTGFNITARREQNVCPGCSSHGTCQYGECLCSSSYYGENCEKEGCHPQCGENRQGQCINNTSTNKMDCACEEGYWGPYCQYQCPGGERNPCSRQGTCNMKNGTCTCEEGYDGFACQYKRCGDTCLKNGGTCFHTTGVCLCDSSRVGPLCELECPSVDNKVCFERGSCVYDNGKAACRCNSLYEGLACESCPKGFTGEFCQIKCTGYPDNICSGNGTCLFDGSCGCHKGYGGETCQETAISIPVYETHKETILPQQPHYRTINVKNIEMQDSPFKVNDTIREEIIQHEPVTPVSRSIDKATGSGCPLSSTTNGSSYQLKVRHSGSVPSVLSFKMTINGLISNSSYGQLVTLTTNPFIYDFKGSVGLLNVSYIISTNETVEYSMELTPHICYSNALVPELEYVPVFDTQYIITLVASIFYTAAVIFSLIVYFAVLIVCFGFSFEKTNEEEEIKLDTIHSDDKKDSDDENEESNDGKENPKNNGDEENLTNTNTNTNQAKLTKRPPSVGHTTTDTYSMIDPKTLYNLQKKN